MWILDDTYSQCLKAVPLKRTPKRARHPSMPISCSHPLVTPRPCGDARGDGGRMAADADDAADDADAAGDAADDGCAGDGDDEHPPYRCPRPPCPGNDAKLSMG